MRSRSDDGKRRSHNFKSGFWLSLLLYLRSIFGILYKIDCQIEYYRDCYERTQSEQIDEDENIPDLTPEEIGSGRELKLAYQTVILAIALRLLSQHSQGDYQFNGRSIGKNREQITLALATEFTFEEIYGNLEEHIETFERDFIYHKLQEFGTSASDLNPYEVKLLDHLLSDYNPLN
ncbi:hypothetical protein LC612_12780 [Nostoc sp. CHAB 5834]|nr:hypothetical protein [Nostoc sp. CHAB 5834]